MIYNIPAFIVRFGGARLGYNLGFGYLNKMKESGMMDKVLLAAGILGIMVIGAMCKDMVYTEVALSIGSGDTAQSLQEILNGIMPGMIGFIRYMGVLLVIEKEVNPLVLILGTMILGIAGKAVGLF